MQRPPDVDSKRLAALVHRACGDADVSLERTPEGVSAQVYPVTKASQIFYLRVAEDAAQDLRVDAEVHHELLRRGVRVPEVICADAEWLVMTEVPGAPVSSGEPEVARAAGRDLARLNQVPAVGFGWIREPLPSYADFVVSSCRRTCRPCGAPPRAPRSRRRSRPSDACCGRARASRMATSTPRRSSRTAVATPESSIWESCAAPSPRSTWAASTCSMAVIRSLWEPLVQGYAEVAGAAAVPLAAIRRSALLLGLRQLCRWIDGPRRLPLDHAAVVARARRLEELLPAR